MWRHHSYRKISRQRIQDPAPAAGLPLRKAVDFKPPLYFGPSGKPPTPRAACHPKLPKIKMTKRIHPMLRCYARSVEAFDHPPPLQGEWMGSGITPRDRDAMSRLSASALVSCPWVGSRSPFG
ncbi:unnamed protein product [Chrysoparadoxa australica]